MKKEQNLDNAETQLLSKPVVRKKLFKNIEDTIRTIDVISSAAFTNDRKLTSKEYQKIKESTFWIKLNVC